jgi:Mitochondrial branched-chain alpha-ketoacid dehydrogenase kinase
VTLLVNRHSARVRLAADQLARPSTPRGDSHSAQHQHAQLSRTDLCLPPCRHMLDFGANPVERQLIMSAQFLRAELPIRLAHRVAELENLPYGLSAKPHVLKVSGSDGIRIYIPAAYAVSIAVDLCAEA